MKTKIYIFILAMFSIAMSLNAQNNTYVWLHGLNGSKISWQGYNNTFTPTNGSLPEYKSTQSIKHISNDLRNANSHLFNRNTILIGHSMGGLVARELERTHSSSIKGIITIGTGHQGAPVAKELKNGKLDVLAKNIYNKTTSSVRASTDAIAAIFLGFPITQINPLKSRIDNFTDKYRIHLGDKIVSAVDKEFNATLVDELSPGSDFLRTLEQRKINVPILTFASEEDRWQLARFGHCQLDYQILALDPNINNNGDYDMAGYNLLNDICNGITTVKNIHNGIATTCDVIGFFLPNWKYYATLNRTAANNWQSTVGYLNNSLDFDHANLIGAIKYEQRSYYEPIFRCSGNAQYINGKQNFMESDTYDCYYDYIYVSYTVPVPQPHDGIVPVASQLLDKSKGNNVIWANTTIKGVNHAEQRNHPNTKREFQRVFAGLSYGGDVFKK